MTTDNTPLQGNGSSAGTPQSYVHLWPRVVDSMRKEFGDSVYNSWVKPLNALTADATRVVLSAPTRFMSDWVQSHYLARLSDYWQAEIGHSVIVDVMVNPLNAKTSAAKTSVDEGVANSQAAPMNPSTNSTAAPAHRSVSPGVSTRASACIRWVLPKPTPP
jgi:chromosomal replication initiator protein